MSLIKLSPALFLESASVLFSHTQKSPNKGTVNEIKHGCVTIAVSIEKIV
jgi:hypothetical protein